MIKQYLVGGSVFCGCDDKGQPLFGMRARRRTLDNGIFRTEREQCQMLIRTRFDEERSYAMDWLRKSLPADFSPWRASKMRMSTIRSVAIFFSMFLDIPIPREAYRRKRNCVFWLDQNIVEIDEACRNYSLQVMKGTKTYTFEPFFLNSAL